MQIRTASQKSAVKQEDPVQKLMQANAHFIRTIWCSLPLHLVQERRSHTSCFSTTLLHMTTSTNWVQMKGKQS